MSKKQKKARLFTVLTDFYAQVRKCLSKHFKAVPEPVRIIIRHVKKKGGSKDVEQKKFSPQKAEKKKSAGAD